MKFRYLLIDEYGNVSGTNDGRVVATASSLESGLVMVDIETGTVDGFAIEEQTIYNYSALPSSD